jgi:hypothetical protein
MRSGAITFLFALASLLTANVDATAQDGAAKPRVTRHFSGDVKLEGPAAPREITVTVEKWLLNERSRVELPSAPDGMLLVYLMSGSLTTISDSERRLRHEGERWTIAPPGAGIVQTDQDSAVLTLTLLRPR